MMIDLTLLQEAGFAIRLHVAVAVLGLIVGGFVLLRPRGTRLHKYAGRVFAFAALTTALSSFFIHEIRVWGLWSPIHLLSLYTIFSTVYAIWAIRKGKVKAHALTMVSVYLSGFVVAGAFTLIPGRMLHDTLLRPSLIAIFKDDRTVGELFVWVIPLLAAMVAWIMWRRFKTIASKGAA